MQFIGFVKFASTYFQQIEREVLLLLGNNSLGKATTENRRSKIARPKYRHWQGDKQRNLIKFFRSF